MTKAVEKIINNFKGEWFTIHFDFNAHKIDKYNVCRHGRFIEAAATLYNKYKNFDEFNTFSLELKKQAQYNFWSKCEYEIIISAWPPSKDGEEEAKWDIYDQLCLNWDAFAKYMFNRLAGASHRSNIYKMSA